MSEHFEALEADFQAVYGLDLREALWGEQAFGVRRVISLIKGLPPRSALVRASATQGRDWSSTEELLATAVELIDFTNRLIFSANSKKGSRIWRALSVPRPFTRRRKPAGSKELARYFRRPKTAGKVVTN